MSLSPDKRMMPRFDERTHIGRMTSDIFKQLSSGEQEGVQELAVQEDIDTRNPLMRRIAARWRRSHERAGEIRATDIVAELIAHEISKVTRRGGGMTIDENLIKAYVRGMIPEGRDEAQFFFQTITDFKAALASGNIEVINAIFENPEHYPGREFAHRFESYDRVKRPRTNERLKLYLRAILERNLADLIDSGSTDDVDRFVGLLDGVDMMDSVERSCIPINPSRITGNPELQARTLDMLTGEFNEGRRPKVNEVLALGIMNPVSIPAEIRQAAAEHAAQTRSPQSREIPFEKQARQLADRGAYGSYRNVARETEVQNVALRSLLDTLRQPENFLKARMNQIKRFDIDVANEIFLPYHGLTPADKTALRRAEEEHAKAVKEGRTADARAHQRTLDAISSRHRRMTPFEFLAFLQAQVRPLLRLNLCEALRQSIDDYVALRNEYFRPRTLSVEPYRYAPLDTTDLQDRNFRENELRPAVEERLGRAHFLPNYALERNILINRGIAGDSELTRWGFSQ